MTDPLPPSIFNDVVGPVMRGPSSSHSAASVRIGRLARDLAGGDPEHVLVEFDTEGSLATTYESQGSALGMHAGLLGFETDDERIPRGRELLAAAGITVETRALPLHDPHPNTYRLTLRRGGVTSRLVALSTGGGMIEVIDIDGTPVSLRGDTHVTLLDLTGGDGEAGPEGALRGHAGVEGCERVTAPGAPPRLIVRGPSFLDERLVAELPGVARARRLGPVLPVETRAGMRVPFLHAGEMVQTADPAARPLSDFALDYECARGGLAPEGVFERMRRILAVVRTGIDGGLRGTTYADRILPQQSDRFAALMDQGRLHDAGVLNRAILYVSALMETKSSMGVIVAAPTAGSCATFPGTCVAAAEAMGADEERTLRAMLAAGLIGVFVTTRSSFAAEVGGCQAETGAGAAMAAAALVDLAGGSAAEGLSAASHALQNVLGLVCDPVANRVEAPCLGRNIAGAANAIACANVALAGYDHLVPLDQVLDVHRAISESMARELRCTGLGGLSVTPASRAIEARLCGEGGCQDC